MSSTVCTVDRVNILSLNPLNELHLSPECGDARSSHFLTFIPDMCTTTDNTDNDSTTSWLDFRAHGARVARLKNMHIWANIKHPLHSPAFCCTQVSDIQGWKMNPRLLHSEIQLSIEQRQAMRSTPVLTHFVDFLLLYFAMYYWMPCSFLSQSLATAMRDFNCTCFVFKLKALYKATCV